MSNPVSGTTKTAFSVEFSNEEEAVQVVIAGNGDMEAAHVLSRYVSVFHAQAQKHKAKLICFDVTRLYFLNPACLKSLASIVALDNKLVPAEQYQIVFRLGLPWQPRTFAKLQILGRGLVLIEDRTPSAQQSNGA